jgi:hypothetical protein
MVFEYLAFMLAEKMKGAYGKRVMERGVRDNLSF